jgi:hypothetical protein
VNRLAIALVGALSFVATGCVQLDASVSGIVASAPDQSFPGAGPAAGLETTMTLTVPLKQDNALVSQVATAQVESVRFVPKAGVTSLDFFRSAKVVLKADGAPDITVIDVGPNQLQAASDGSVTLPVVLDLDAKKYLVDSLHIDATLDLLAPANDWTLGIDITLTVSGGTTLHI